MTKGEGFFTTELRSFGEVKTSGRNRLATGIVLLYHPKQVDRVFYAEVGSFAGPQQSFERRILGSASGGKDRFTDVTQLFVYVLRKILFYHPVMGGHGLSLAKSFFDLERDKPF